MNSFSSRRDFLKASGTLIAGSALIPAFARERKAKNVGLQLYSVRNEMLADAVGTLKKLAKIGYKELESARSAKGNYYGLTPKEFKKVCTDLGMKLVSGHVHIDDKWKRYIDDALETGQQYLVCSSLPTSGQTIENYQKTADIFTRAAEDCAKANIQFAYHNHDYEFEKVGDKILYDVLLDRSDAKLVKMELDLGWVVVTGNDPLVYFSKYPNRFPLWHLKDMDMVKKQSTEFGKGVLNIRSMMKNAGKSGMKHFFVEQEEYTNSAFESVEHDFRYLKKMS